MPRRFEHSCHAVAGLHFARFSSGPPSASAWAKAAKRARGAKAKGHRFERQVGKALAAHCAAAGWRLRLSQWVEFWDASGRHFAQIDAIVEAGDFVVLVESKLTYTDFAWEQLEALYLPLACLLYGAVQIRTVQACRALTGPTASVLHAFPSSLDALPPGRQTWLYLGR